LKLRGPIIVPRETTFQVSTIIGTLPGATEDDCAGSCVTHTHIHLIPGMSEYAQVLDNVFPQIYKGEELKLPGSSTPYIFLREELNRVRIFEGDNIPSQMIRQVICGSLGRDDWSWRELPRLHLINETLQFWRDRNV